jgi:hypothetical protein
MLASFIDCSFHNILNISAERLSLLFGISKITQSNLGSKTSYPE